MGEIPERIGRYEIIGVIGEGGMGVVYKARDPNIGRIVALKVIKPDLAQDQESAQMIIERFKREARAAGILQHPGIVTVYDADEYQGMPFIAMEFVEGQSLDKLIAEQRLSISESARIIAHAARALAFAHEKGIIHRDIKPSNIMITKDAAPKIMDFGIARTQDSNLTQTGMMVGSPNYMSPEQVAGAKADQRSDLFSLGVVLYQLLTGQRPFRGETQCSVLYQIAKVDPPKPSQLNSLVDPRFDKIIEKALAKKPAARYSSGLELAQDLERLLGEQSLDRPAVDKTQVSANKHRAIPVSTSAILLEGEEKITAARPTTRDRQRILLFTLPAAALLTAIILALILFSDPYKKIDEHIAAGRHKEALEALNKLAAHHLHDPRPLFLLGIEYAALRDFRSAIVSFSRALAIDPELKNEPRLVQTLLPAEQALSELIADFIKVEIGEPAIPVLEQALSDQDYNVRWNAKAALAALGKTVDILPLLALDLRSPDCAVRTAAARKIAELRDQRGIPELRAARDRLGQEDCAAREINAALAQLSQTKPEAKDTAPGRQQKDLLDPLKDIGRGLRRIIERQP